MRYFADTLLFLFDCLTYFRILDCKILVWTSCTQNITVLSKDYGVREFLKGKITQHNLSLNNRKTLKNKLTSVYTFLL